MDGVPKFVASPLQERTDKAGESRERDLVSTPVKIEVMVRQGFLYSLRDISHAKKQPTSPRTLWYGTHHDLFASSHIFNKHKDDYCALYHARHFDKHRFSRCHAITDYNVTYFAQFTDHPLINGMKTCDWK